MGEREQRIGATEALHRSVNERIEAVNEAFGTVTDTFSIVCECGDTRCTEQIEIAISDYERVRADPTLFVLKPGHEIGRVEQVVERHDEYDVVRKREGEPAELAREHDPRS
jgi:hypothetical protein